MCSLLVCGVSGIGGGSGKPYPCTRALYGSPLALRRYLQRIVWLLRRHSIRCVDVPKVFFRIIGSTAVATCPISFSALLVEARANFVALSLTRIKDWFCVFQNIRSNINLQHGSGLHYGVRQCGSYLFCLFCSLSGYAHVIVRAQLTSDWRSSQKTTSTCSVSIPRLVFNHECSVWIPTWLETAVAQLGSPCEFCVSHFRLGKFVQVTILFLFRIGGRGTRFLQSEIQRIIRNPSREQLAIVVRLPSQSRFGQKSNEKWVCSDPLCTDPFCELPSCRTHKRMVSFSIAGSVGSSQGCVAGRRGACPMAGAFPIPFCSFVVPLWSLFFACQLLVFMCAACSVVYARCLRGGLCWNRLRRGTHPPGKHEPWFSRFPVLSVECCCAGILVNIVHLM